MRSIKKILLPTDFSECAEPATALAIKLGQTFKAEVIILFVYNAPLYFGVLAEMYMVPVEVVERLRSEAERNIEQLRQRAAEVGVSASGLAMEGMARDRIIEIAQSNDVDLIVMGTHGRTGLRHLVPGSTAEHVVRTAPCPVLTVRPKTTPESDPALQISRQAPGIRRERSRDSGRVGESSEDHKEAPMRSIRNILLPTDFSDTAEQATALAIEMAQAFSAKLLLLYVYDVPVYLGPFDQAYTAPPEILEKVRHNAERALENLRERASTAGVAVESFALPGLPRDVIVEVAQSRVADLIVMGTHGRTGFRHLLLGSVAERVVRMAPCPVMTVGVKVPSAKAPSARLK